MRNPLTNEVDVNEKEPVERTIVVDESGLGTETPDWFKEEATIPDARLREIVLVGATPDDFPPTD